MNQQSKKPQDNSKPLLKAQKDKEIEKTKEIIENMKKNLQEMQDKCSNNYLLLRGKRASLAQQKAKLTPDNTTPVSVGKDRRQTLPIEISLDNNKLDYENDNDEKADVIFGREFKLTKNKNSSNSQVLLIPETERKYRGYSIGERNDFVRKFLQSNNKAKDDNSQNIAKSSVKVDKSKKKNTFCSASPNNPLVVLKKEENFKLNVKENEDDDEFFDKLEIDQKPIELSKEEKVQYGAREPKGYTKLKILGKGGCGFVFLAKNNEGKEFAIKQIFKKTTKMEGTLKVAKKEIEVLCFLKEKIPNDLKQLMIELIESYEDANDLWIIFEKSGHNLSSFMFKIKGEFIKNERIYVIQKGVFLKSLNENLNVFKEVLRRILNFLNFLSGLNMAHCDIKPENILLDFNFDPLTNEISSLKFLKIIDFGSAFFLNSPENFGSNTPEYMSPEINELTEKGASNSKIQNYLKTMNPWSIDIWSLGVTILEIVLSCPLWMSFKSKITRNNKIIYTTGLFGVKGRASNKIHLKQIEVANNVTEILKDCLIRDEKEREMLIDLTKKMLNLNEKKRISPIECLNHPFLIES